MAQAPVQSTLISLFEARELIRQRYLDPELAGELLVKRLDDQNEPVRWQYEYIKNNSGLSDSVGLRRFWRPGLSINWKLSSAARKIEPRTAPRRMVPGLIVRTSYLRSPPESQLGNPFNFFVYGIRVAREDVELRLREEYGAPVSEPAFPPFASTTTHAPKAFKSRPPPPRGTLERRVYDRMEEHPPQEGDRRYVAETWNALGRPGKRKTVQNLVGKYREQFEVPKKPESAQVPAGTSASTSTSTKKR